MHDRALLVVVVADFRTGSGLEGFVLFLLAYAAGMGLVVGTLAVATVFASPHDGGSAPRRGRWAPLAARGLLAAAGLYVAYYGWWELRVLGGGDASDPVIEAAATLQQGLAGLSAAPGPVGSLVAGLILLMAVLAVVSLPPRGAADHDEGEAHYEGFLR